MNVLSYSQNLQNNVDFKPFITSSEGKTGVLISFQRMDSISKQMIDFKFTTSDKDTYFKLYMNEKKVSQENKRQYLKEKSNASKFESLYAIAEEQRVLEHGNFNEQKKMTTKAKWQWGCGGVAVGLGIVGVLSIIK